MSLINYIRFAMLPHYQILGHYTGEVIGCTRGKQGKLYVLAEEPLATFRRCSSSRCEICKEVKSIWR